MNFLDLIISLKLFILFHVVIKITYKIIELKMLLLQRLLLKLIIFKMMLWNQQLKKIIIILLLKEPLLKICLKMDYKMNNFQLIKINGKEFGLLLKNPINKMFKWLMKVFWLKAEIKLRVKWCKKRIKFKWMILLVIILLLKKIMIIDNMLICQKKLIFKMNQNNKKIKIKIKKFCNNKKKILMNLILIN